MSSVNSTATLRSMPLFKGKSTYRSWLHLPEELVRLVISYCLHTKDIFQPYTQAYNESLPVGPRSRRLLSIYMGCLRTVAAKDGLYMYTRLDRTRKKHHVRLSRMAQSE